MTPCLFCGSLFQPTQYHPNQKFCNPSCRIKFNAEKVKAEKDGKRSKIFGYGLCACGCGQKTKIATENNKRCGWVKGEPLKYINGHNIVTRRMTYKKDPDREITKTQACKKKRDYKPTPFVGDDGTVEYFAHFVIGGGPKEFIPLDSAQGLARSGMGWLCR